LDALAKPGSPMAEPPPQTIELTGKRWKGLQLISIVAMVVGLVLGFAGYPRVLLILCIPGLIGLTVAKAGAWWHHR
jgi:hypothetical protein